MKNEEVRVRWMNLVKYRNAFCYFKPTMYRHESGFRTFEIGYLIVGEYHKMKEKLVLGKCSDHIWLLNMDMFNTEKIKDINMDLLLDGYIRIFSHEILTWDNTFDYVVSTAQIEIMEQQ